MGIEAPRLISTAFNGDFIPALNAYEYRGYMISAWARPEFADGSTSVGIIYQRDELGSIIQVQRIVGELFESKEQAERHGVKLCKEWIDQQAEVKLLLEEKSQQSLAQIETPDLRNRTITASLQQVRY